MPVATVRFQATDELCHGKAVNLLSVATVLPSLLYSKTIQCIDQHWKHFYRGVVFLPWLREWN